MLISEIDFQELDAFQWDELHAECPDATVFQGRMWLQAYARVFARSRQDLKVIAATEGGRLVGLAPLMRAAGSDRARGADWLILGDDYSDYQSFLAWGGSPKIIEALLDTIDRILPRGESVAFCDVPRMSTLGLCLAARAARGQIIAGDTTACPTLQVRGNPDGVARVLGKASLRRSERSLSALGEIEVEHIRDAAQIARRLPDLYAQHEDRWRDSDTPSLFRQDQPKEFFSQVAARLGPRGCVLYTIVSLNGKVVAQHFGLQSKGALLWYKPAFDVALRKHSPGDTLLKTLVQYTREVGLRELDFTRGDEPFKERFASLVRYNQNFYWYRHIGKHISARMRRRARAVRIMVGNQRATTMHSLGGAAQAKRRSRVLLLNADQATTAAWGVVERDEGICVRATSYDDVSEMTERCDATLIVPCDDQSVAALLRLPLDHPARRSAMLPESLCSPSQSARVNSGSEEVRKEEAVAVIGICAGGDLLQHFVSTNGSPKPRELAVTLLHRAGIELRRLAWHGPVTVQFVDNGRGQLAVSRILPLLQRVDTALRSGVNLPLVLWQLASGLRVAPQASVLG